MDPIVVAFIEDFSRFYVTMKLENIFVPIFAGLLKDSVERSR